MKVILLVALVFLSLVVVQAAPIPGAASQDYGGAKALDATFTAQITLSNTGDAAGYGAFLDLVLQPDVTLVSATYLGLAVATDSSTFNPAGCINHPYAVNAASTALQVCHTQGASLHTFRLPFASYAHTQPASDVVLTLRMSASALVGQNIPAYLRTGFHLGATPEVDPATDPSILTTTNSDPTTWSKIGDAVPAEITIDIQHSGSSLTGPSFTRTVTCTLNVPNGFTLSSPSFLYTLDNKVAYVANSVTGGTADKVPAVSGAPATPSVDHVVRVPIAGSITGASHATSFQLHVLETDANGARILDAATGNPVNGNGIVSVTVSGTYPVQEQKSVTNISGTFYWLETVNKVLSAGSSVTIPVADIVVTSAVSIASDTNSAGYTPGDTLQYSISAQASNYFNFGNLVLTDTISDGQTFDGTFTPTVQLTGAGAAQTIPNTGLYPVTTLGDQSTRITFATSDALIARAFQAQGLLTPGATVTVVYRAVIDDAFSGTNGNRNLIHGDTVTETSAYAGGIRDNSNTTVTVSAGSSLALGSDSTSARIIIGTATQTLYALNGVVCDPCTNANIYPNDVLTFRMKYTLPSTDFTGIAISFFLPGPLVLASDVTTFNAQNPTASSPVSGAAHYGPDDTFYNFQAPGSQVAPTLTTSTVTNVVKFVYGSFTDVSNQFHTLDILFSVTVKTTKYPDQLALTVLGIVEESQSEIGQSSASLLTIRVNQPVAAIATGAVATSNAGSTFSTDVTPGSRTWSAPGTASCPRFNSGTAPITSTSGALRADLTNFDAGDIITVATIVENTGTGYTYDITTAGSWSPSTSWGKPTDGYRTCVTDGAGNALAHSLTETATGVGITLTGTTQSTVLQPSNTDGTNVLIITYDVEATQLVAGDNLVTSTNALTRYAGYTGGDNHVTSTTQDSSTATVTKPTISVAVTSTHASSQYNTGLNDVRRGETVEYTITITLPEGTNGVTVTHQLPLTPFPMAVASSRVSSIGANIYNNVLNVNDPGTASDTNTDGINDRVTFSVGTAVGNTADGTNDAKDTIVFTVTATVALDSVASGYLLSATSQWTYTDSSVSTSVDVELIDPVLAISHARDVTNVDAGDTVTYTVSVAHNTGTPSRSDAYSLTVAVALPSTMALTPGTVVVSGTGVGANVVQGNGGGHTSVQVTFTSLGVDPAQTISIVYEAVVQNTVTPRDVPSNTATVTYYTLPSNSGKDFSSSASVNFQVASPTVSYAMTTSDSNTGTSSGNNFYLSGGEDIAVGEPVTLTTTITVIEGTDTLRVTIGSPAGQTVKLPIQSWTATQLPSSITGIAIDSSTITGTHDDQLIVDFGTITNPPNNVVDNNDKIIITVNALAIDDPVNKADGTLLETQALLSYDTYTRTSTSTRYAEVIEPDLSFTLTSSVETVDSGDEITYTLTVAHSASSKGPAYEVVLTSAAVTHLTLSAGTVTTTTGTLTTGNTLGDTTVRVDIPTFALGAANIVVTWKSVVGTTAVSGSSITATGNGAYRSTPTAQTVKRSYSGSASKTVSVAAPLRSVTIIDTSVSDTGVVAHTNTVTDLAIGETATFEVVATLAEGTTNNFRVTMAVPATAAGQMSIVSATVHAVGSQISGSALAVNDPGTISDSVTLHSYLDTVIFTFGTVVNTPDGVVDDKDRFKMRVVARLESDVSTANGDQLTTSTLFDWTTANAIISTLVDVVEPVLNIAKSVDKSSGDALDIHKYTVVITHTASSRAHAYMLQVDDALTSTVDLRVGTVTATVESSAGGAATDISGQIIKGNTPGDTVVEFRHSDLTWSSTASQIIRITYEVTLKADVTAGQTIASSVTLDWYSLPAAASGSRKGSDSSIAVITVTSPALSLTSSVTDTSLSETDMSQHNGGHLDLAIGEEITMRLVITTIEGQDSVTLVVNMPKTTTGKLSAISAGVDSVGSSLPASLSSATITISDTNADSIPDRVTIPFGSFTNTGDNTADSKDQITLHVVARVVDITENADGDSLISNGVLSSSNGGSDTKMLTVDLVEPQLQIVVNPSTSTGDNGDTITYTSTVSQLGASTAPAFGLQQTASFTELVTLKVGSVTANTGGTVVSGNSGGDTAARVDTTSFTLGASALVSSFQGTLTYKVQPASTAPNPVSLVFQSCPNSCAVKRVYTPLTSTPIVNIFANTVTKIRSSANASPVVGEIVTYRVTLRFFEGRSNDTTLVDTLPNGLAAVSILSLTADASLTTEFGNGFDDVQSNATITNNGRTITFPFSNVFNPLTNDNAQQVVIEYTAVVLDVVGTARGTSLVNSARLTWNTGNVVDTATALVVAEPTLTLGVVATESLLNREDTVEYRISMAHSVASNAVAHDVVVSVTLPTNFEFQTSSLASISGPLPTQAGGPTVYTFSLSSLSLGSSIQFKFILKIKPAASFGDNLTPSTTLAWTTLAGDKSTAQSVYNTASVERALSTSVVGPTVKVNTPPTVVNDAMTLNEDTSKVAQVTDNDSDVDGNLNKASVTVTSGPSHGSTSVDVNGHITYTPTAHYNGNDGLTYRVCDTTASGACSTGTLSITVTQVFDPVIASNDAVSVDEDGSIDADVLANDTDADNDINASATGVTITVAPSHGTAVVLVDGKIRYTPTSNYNGADSLTYRVSDTNNFSSDTAVVTITVNAVNDDPTIVVPASPISIVEDTLTNINGISCADIDAGANAIRATVSVSNGMSTLGTKTGLTFSSGDGNADAVMVFTGTPAAISSALGNLKYQGNLHYVGDDQIQITINDQGNVGSGGGGDVRGTVNVTVTQVNDPIVANDDTATTAEDVAIVISVIANDVDPENAIAANSVTVTVAPSNGATSVNPTSGAITYSPNLNFNGVDTFTYRVSDVPGTSDTATVTVTVTAVNDAPTISLSATSLPEDVATFVSASMTDVDAASGQVVVDIRCGTLGAQLTATTTTGIAMVNGTLAVSNVMTSDSACNLAFRGTVAQVNTVLGTLKYKSKLHFVGTDSLSISVDDQGNTGSGGAQETTVSAIITVTPVNDPIVAVDDAYTISEDISFAADVTQNDIDIEGDKNLTSLTISSPPSHGTATLSTAPVGLIIYVPSLNYVGQDTLKYKIKDNAGTESEATVTFTIQGVNDFPVITGTKNPILFQDTVATLPGLGISDVDIASGHFTIAISAEHGTFTVPNRAGFNFTVGDGVGDRALKVNVLGSTASTELPKLQYLGPVGYVGADVITISANDNGFTGSGGARNTSYTIPVTIITRPRVVSMVANDPDDMDAILGDGDTLTLTFSEPTSRPSVATKADIDALLSFSVPVGTAYSASWTSNTTLYITLTDTTGSNRPLISQLNVTVSTTIKNAAGTAPAFPGPFKATGDWGLLAGPSIGRLTANDPDDLDSVYGNDDTISIIFDHDTNQPDVSTRARIDAVMAFSTPLGYNYTGTWVSPNELLITIVEYRTPGTRLLLQQSSTFVAPVLGNFFITMKDGVTNKAGTSLPSVAASPQIDGDWGLGTRFLPCVSTQTTSSDNRTVIVTFETATTRPNPSRKVDIDALIVFAPPLVGDYTGQWQSDVVLHVRLQSSTVNQPLDVKPAGTSSCPSILGPGDAAEVVSGGTSALDQTAIPKEDCNDLLPVAPLVCAGFLILLWSVIGVLRFKRPGLQTLWKFMLPLIRRQQERNTFVDKTGPSFFGDRVLVEDLELECPSFWRFMLSPEIRIRDLDRVDKRELVLDPEFREETRPIMNQFEGQHMPVSAVSQVSLFVQLLFFVLMIMFLWLCYWLAALILSLLYIGAGIGFYLYYSMYWMHDWEQDEEIRQARRRRSDTAMSGGDGTIPAIPALLPAVVLGDHHRNEAVEPPVEHYPNPYWNTVRAATRTPAALPMTPNDPRLLAVLKRQSLHDMGYDPDQTVPWDDADSPQVPKRHLPAFMPRSGSHLPIPMSPAMTGPQVRKPRIPPPRLNASRSGRNLPTVPPPMRPPSSGGSGAPVSLPPLRALTSNDDIVDTELETRELESRRRRMANNTSMSNLLAASRGHSGTEVAAPPGSRPASTLGPRRSAAHLPPPPRSVSPRKSAPNLPPPVTDGQIRAKAVQLFHDQERLTNIHNAEKEVQREKMMEKLREKKEQRSPRD